MKKAKKTFGLAVLLKLAGLSLPEKDGEYQISDKKEVYDRCKSAVKAYGLRFKV